MTAVPSSQSTGVRRLSSLPSSVNIAYVHQSHAIETKRFSSTKADTKKQEDKPNDTTTTDEKKPKAEESSKPTATMKDAFMFLIPHLWPKNRIDHKIRLLTLLSFAFGGKMLFVAVPFYFKGVVDSLVASSAGKSGGAATAAGETTAATATSDAVAEAATEAVKEEAEHTFAVEMSAAFAEAMFGVGTFALVAAYGVTRAAAAFMTEMRMALFTRVSADAYMNINESLLMKLLNLDLQYHMSRKTGAITKIIERGSRAFSSMAWCLIFIFIPTGFEMGLVCTLLQQQVGSEFVIVAVSAVVTYIGWTTKVTNWRAQFRDKYNEQDTKCGSMVVDSLLNFETVKYFRNETHEAKRLRAANGNLMSNLVMLDKSMCALNFGQQFIFICAATTSLYFASTGVLAGTMTVGDLVLVDALLMQLYSPLSWLGIVYREMTTSTQDMRAMLDLLNRPPALLDAPDATKLQFNKGTIEFRNATFSYGDKMILNDVTLKIPGGSLAAFVGPSGTGKTTIFRLLFRLLPLTSGQVLIDGQDVTKLTMDSVRERIGVIPQDTVMFNDTVTYNIGYGKLGSSTEEIEAVAEQACIHDSILNFGDGYDTVVGERGLKLSGGEKQRVAIARVLLQNPEIILADEATSALDTQTEASVVRTLRNNSNANATTDRRTVVMIAHRLTTVKACDVIFVLGRDGRIAEQGTHDELLRTGGLYSRLWNQQLHEGASPDSISETEEAVAVEGIDGDVGAPDGDHSGNKPVKGDAKEE